MLLPTPATPHTQGSRCAPNYCSAPLSIRKPLVGCKKGILLVVGASVKWLGASGRWLKQAACNPVKSSTTASSTAAASTQEQGAGLGPPGGKLTLRNFARFQPLPRFSVLLARTPFCRTFGRPGKIRLTCDTPHFVTKHPTMGRFGTNATVPQNRRQVYVNYSALFGAPITSSRLLTNTSRGRAPSAGPIMPCSSIVSIKRAARA